AVRLVNKDKKILAICGDGGFIMNSHELETAVRLKIDLCILVLRDDALGMIKWKQEGMGLQCFGLDYGNPDFVKFAGSFGAHGHRVTSAERLSHTIKDCLHSPGVHLIEVPIDYSESHAVFYEELKSRLCVL
ncbi:MAG: acetolactate synthase large subunit, partial [Planctomycetes bacterium]|nr:acetolactate synthase large subunit [Planctomycetota bacterium]